jgi:O-antigen/teichoic acid export membrane protein
MALQQGQEGAFMAGQRYLWVGRQDDAEVGCRSVDDGDGRDASGQGVVAGRLPSLRGVLGAGSANVVARGLAVLVGLVTVPFVAHALDPAEFGLYLALTTVFAMLSSLDFGIGGAVLSQVSAAAARRDSRLLASVVSSALASLVLAALALLLLGVVAVAVLPLARLLGADAVDRTSLAAAAFATAAATAAAIPLSVAGRALFGLHRGQVASLFAVLGSLCQAVLLVVCALGGGPLSAFVLAGTSAVVVAGALTTWHLLRTWEGVRPSWHLVSSERVRALAGEGGLLFALALIGLVAYQSDTVIVSHYLGAATVPDFALPLRVFGLIPLLAGLFMTPLWAAYRDARERRRWEWISRTFRRSMAGTLAVVLLTVVMLIPITPWLLDLWVGDEVRSPGLDLRLALASYVVVMALSACVAAYLNAMTLLRVQALLGLAMALANIALSVWLVQKIGVEGPVWATVITQTCIVLVPCTALAARHLRRESAG